LPNETATFVFSKYIDNLSTTKVDVVVRFNTRIPALTIKETKLAGSVPLPEGTNEKTYTKFSLSKERLVADKSTITFVVLKNFVDDNKLEPTAISLKRLSSSGWIKLDVSYLGEEGAYHTYRTTVNELPTTYAVVADLLQKKPALTQITDKLADIVDEQLIVQAFEFEQDLTEFADIKDEPLFSALRAKFAVINIIRMIFVLTVLFLFIELGIETKRWIKIRINPLEGWIMKAKKMGIRKERAIAMLQKRNYKNVVPLANKIYSQSDRPLLITGIIVIVLSFSSLAAISFFITYNVEELKILVLIILIVGFVLTALSKAMPIILLKKHPKLTPTDNTRFKGKK